jgi:hypothetical protein
MYPEETAKAESERPLGNESRDLISDDSDQTLPQHSDPKTRFNAKHVVARHPHASVGSMPGPPSINIHQPSSPTDDERDRLNPLPLSPISPLFPRYAASLSPDTLSPTRTIGFVMSPTSSDETVSPEKGHQPFNFVTQQYTAGRPPALATSPTKV